MSKDIPFVHLHLHTPYSLIDGFCRIDPMIELAKEYNMTAVGVSEHGNCRSHIEFYKKCKEAGIKPILGNEIYITPHRSWKKADFDEQKKLFDWRPHLNHLLLIAKTQEGYKNLLELSSRAQLEGFYRKPRADYELLKEYGKGLIATTACLGSETSQLILKGKYRLAKNLIRFYQSCVDELYFEIQPSDMPEQLEVNKVLIEWSKEMDIPLVATTDAHMLKKEEKPIHAALTTIGKNEDPNDISVYEHCYFMSSEEVLSFGIPEEALLNTQRIADKCNVELELGETKYPTFNIPKEYSFQSYLKEKTESALFDLMLSKDIDIDEYQKRLYYELEVIEKKKFAAYFLIVHDFIDWSKKKEILVGPGRGSGAGSLVCYLLGITNMDPIKYKLLFERFLNPERKSFPDLDIDFDDQRRHEVIDYVSQKYGEDKVAHIGTFTTLSTKMAFKDIGRGLGIDHNLINEMNKLIPSHQGKVASIDQALEEVPALQEWKEKYPKLFELAEQVKNLPRSASVHACGLAITDEKTSSYSALFKGKKGESVTEYDGETLEEIGIIKFDFLGLKTLSVIDKARKLVKEHHQKDIDPDQLVPEDDKVFKMIQKGETDGVFQFESPGMKDLFKGLKKVDFESLVAGTSLYRPGPMAFIPEYQARANGINDVEKIDPVFDDITKETYGIIIYQEQLMQIAVRMGSFTPGAADAFRKGVGKKKEELVEEQLGLLAKGMRNNNYSEEMIKRVDEIIRPFAAYGFNRSHAAAYSFISYQTAYFKYYYPIEFTTAILSVFHDKEEKVSNYIRMANKMGIDVLPPHLNLSSDDFKIENDAIRYGFNSIKSLKEKAMKVIKARRPFPTTAQLIDETAKGELDKASIKALAFSGSLDSFYDSNMNRMEILKDLFDKRKYKDDLSVEIKNFKHKTKCDIEKEYLGVYLTDHPLKEIGVPIDWDTLNYLESKETAGIVIKTFNIVTKKGDDMAILTLSTIEEQKEFVCFPGIYESIKDRLTDNVIIKFKFHKKYNARYDKDDLIIEKATIPKRINKDILDMMEEGVTE